MQDRTGARPRAAPWPGWVEALGLFVVYQGFEQLRALLVGKAGPALRHGRWIADLERWTWTLHEPPLNHWVVAHVRLAQTFNIYYGTVHFVVPPAVLLWLWRRHPDRYGAWRTLLAAVTVAGLVAFVVFPAAPPRLVPASAHATFRDTTPLGGLGPLDRGHFTDPNPYAAMPSLHAAWSLWSALAVIAAAAPRRRAGWRRATLLYPAATAVVVVGTANHWIADVVAGWLLVGALWWLLAATSRFRVALRRGTQDSGAPAVAARSGTGP